MARPRYGIYAVARGMRNVSACEYTGERKETRSNPTEAVQMDPVASMCAGRRLLVFSGVAGHVRTALRLAIPATCGVLQVLDVRMKPPPLGSVYFQFGSVWCSQF